MKALQIFLAACACMPLLAAGDATFEARLLKELTAEPTASKTEYADNRLRIRELVSALDEESFYRLVFAPKAGMFSLLNERGEVRLADALIVRLTELQDQNSIVKVLATLRTGGVSFQSCAEYLSSEFGLEGFDLLFKAYEKSRSKTCRQSISGHLQEVFDRILADDTDDDPDDDQFVKNASKWFAANRHRLKINAGRDRSDPSAPPLVELIK